LSAFLMRSFSVKVGGKVGLISVKSLLELYSLKLVSRSNPVLISSVFELIYVKL
ncbi:19554_t:CDS:2, partial [Funneliformis geosporum]